MKWSELKALVEAEIEKYSLDDPEVTDAEIYYDSSDGTTYRIVRIGLQHECSVYEVFDKRPE